MIKYLGSKRRLVGVLGALVSAAGARTVLDLFTGTTRVAQACKAGGAAVTAVDLATYAHVFAECYIATDARAIDAGALTAAVGELNAVAPRAGYVTEVFCHQARYFHPDNGARIDAIRDRIDADHAGTALWPILLTSLIEAADRVDSTTGVQMAYLKQWAPRALRPLELRVPDLLAGPGRAVRGDAAELVASGVLGHHDVAYLDPPYNQHRYFTNYHVWETLVRWDAPEHYGVACKRVDSRSAETRSAFNAKRAMPAALADVVAGVDADLVVVSYNDEAWVAPADLEAMCAARGAAEVLSFDSKRYVGAQIGIHDPSGRRVGAVSHTHNRELVVVAGEPARVAAVVDAARRVAPAVPA